jgi:hypothetical protein
MHPFSSFRWPRFLQISALVLLVSVTPALFQLPAPAQGESLTASLPTGALSGSFPAGFTAPA